MSAYNLSADNHNLDRAETAGTITHSPPLRFISSTGRNELRCGKTIKLVTFEEKIGAFCTVNDPDAMGEALGRVNERSSLLRPNGNQAGICDGDQLGAKSDVGR